MTYYGNIQIFNLGDMHAIEPFETITNIGDIQTTIAAGKAALNSWCNHDRGDKIHVYETDEGLLFRIVNNNNEPIDIYAGAEKKNEQR